MARRPLQPGDSNVPKTPSSRLRRVCQRSQSSGDKPEIRRRSRAIYSRNVASESFVAREFLCIATSGIGTRRCQVDGRPHEISDPFGHLPSSREDSHERRTLMRACPLERRESRRYTQKRAAPNVAAAPVLGPIVGRIIATPGELHSDRPNRRQSNFVVRSRARSGAPAP